MSPAIAPTTSAPDQLEELAQKVIRCRGCARLVEHCQETARTRRRAFSDWEYWGRPVPGFGDAAARLLVVGLAPAAHGGNRTGRMFTGDRSGDWLYRTLHRFGFATQPTSTRRDDGQQLVDCYITAAVHCAPPANKPLPEEFDRCRSYLQRELHLLRRLRVVVALGRVAFDNYLLARAELRQHVPRPRPAFAHGASYVLPELILIGSYHPSQRNTQTGFLTAPMFEQVFAMARAHLDS